MGAICCDSKPSCGLGQSNGVIMKLSIMMFIQFFVWGAWFTTPYLALGKAGIGSVTGDAYGSAPIAAILAPLFLGIVADRFFASEKVMGVLLALGGACLCVVPHFANQAHALNDTFAPLLKALQEAPEGVKLLADNQAALAQKAEGVKDLAKESGAFLDAFSQLPALAADLSQKVAAAKSALGEYNQRCALIAGLFLAHMLCYMPTLGLGNTIAFSNIKDQSAFPKIRVWGTIGWIAAGLTCGFLGWSDSLNMFMLAGASSLILGAYCFFALPTTPPPAKGQPLNLRALLMVDAFKMLLNPAFAVFIVCSTLICIPLAFYYGITGGFLANCGFTQPASTMTIGQMSEIVFMLLIPFFFARLGVKWMILVGMLAWVARYFLFAMGAPDQVAWMLFLGVALHGICYDFFFVTGFIYTDKRAPKEVRGQAQSMLVFFTQGIGMFLGFKVAFADDKSPFKVAFGDFGQSVTKQADLGAAIAKVRPEETLSFGEKFTKMFSVDLPATVDSNLVHDTMAQWKSFWMVPALMAAAIAVLFFIGFWDKVAKTEPSAEETAKAAGAEELP